MEIRRTIAKPVIAKFRGREPESAVGKDADRMRLSGLCVCVCVRVRACVPACVPACVRGRA